MRFVLGLLALFASVPAVAQVPDHVTDVLRRIFASAEFAPQRFGPARWIENGTAYTTVEKSAVNPDASDIVRYETGPNETARRWGSRRGDVIFERDTAPLRRLCAPRLVPRGSYERRLSAPRN